MKQASKPQIKDRDPALLHEFDEIIAPYVCANPDDFTADDYADAVCYNIDEMACDSIPGLEWDGGMCFQPFLVAANAAVEGACTAAGGNFDGMTCEMMGHELMLELHFSGIDEPPQSDACANIFEHLGYGAFWFYWHLPTACCGGEMSVGVCERDQMMCADDEDYTPANVLHGECVGPTDEGCDGADHFSWECEDHGEGEECACLFDGHDLGGHTEFEVAMACSAINGTVSDDTATCAYLNSMYSFAAAYGGLPEAPLNDDDGSCYAFFGAADELYAEIGEDDPEASFAFTRQFFDMVLPYTCCSSEPAVCMWESEDRCDNLFRDYEPPETLRDCPEAALMEWDECLGECAAAVTEIYHDLECCTPNWLEYVDPDLDLGNGEDAVHHVIDVCEIPLQEDPLFGCPGRRDGPCPQCDEFSYYAAELGFPVLAPVCGINGITYDNECAASSCGGTFAACEGECPCDEAYEPGCLGVDLPQIGHQSGPPGAYETVRNVTWASECCAICDADPECAGYTWTSVVFAMYYYGGGTPDCMLFDSVVDGEVPHDFCYSGNKLPEEYLAGDDLPSYWRALADNPHDVDVSRLAYAIEENMWYIDGLATCVGFGSHDAACDPTQMLCAGADGATFGYGNDQMRLLAEVAELPEYRTRHPLCPVCLAEPWQPGHVVVCIGPSSAMEVPVEDAAGYPMPGENSPYEPGVYLDCYCDEHHLGVPLVEDSYWWGVAESAGVEPELLTHYDGMWFHDERFTCVGKGTSSATCPDEHCVCAGGSGEVYGSGAQQMAAIDVASGSFDGMHPDCPMPPSGP